MTKLIVFYLRGHTQPIIIKETFNDVQELENKIESIMTSEGSCVKIKTDDDVLLFKCQDLQGVVTMNAPEEQKLSQTDEEDSKKVSQESDSIVITDSDLLGGDTTE